MQTNDWCQTENYVLHRYLKPIDCDQTKVLVELFFFIADFLSSSW